MEKIKNVKKRVEAPINDGPDILSDAMCENLFDDMEYIEHEYNMLSVDLGFIDELPMSVEWVFGQNVVLVSLVNKFTTDDYKIDLITKELKERLSDEQVDAEVEFCGTEKITQWRCFLYYNDAWAKENLG